MEQMRFFVAENAPEIELAEIKLVPNLPATQGLVTLVLRNNGGTTARKINIELVKFGETKPLFTSAKMGAIFERMSIVKGKTERIPILRIEDLAETIGREPKSLRVHNFGDKMAQGESVVAFVQIQYEGEFEDRHARMYSIAMTINTDGK
jgi:hypothetical protein